MGWAVWKDTLTHRSCQNCGESVLWHVGCRRCQRADSLKVLRHRTWLELGSEHGAARVPREAFDAGPRA